MEEITMLSGNVNLHDFFSFLSFFIFFLSSQEKFDCFLCCSNRLLTEECNKLKNKNYWYFFENSTLFSPGKKIVITISYQIFSIREQLKLNKILKLLNVLFENTIFYEKKICGKFNHFIENNNKEI